MSYPKSLFRNDGGNWVGRSAKDAEEEAQLKAQGFSDLVVADAKPKLVPTPFFTPPPAAKPKDAK